LPNRLKKAIAEENGGRTIQYFFYASQLGKGGGEGRNPLQKHASIAKVQDGGPQPDHDHLREKRFQFTQQESCGRKPFLRKKREGRGARMSSFKFHSEEWETHSEDPRGGPQGPHRKNHQRKKGEKRHRSTTRNWLVTMGKISAHILW